VSIESFWDVGLQFLAEGLTGALWWQALLVALVLTHLTIVSVTLYLHRHSAHRSLDLHPALAHGFRFWLWLSTGMKTRDWSAIHRKHHAKCEQEGDPHSPVVFGIKKVFWQGAELYRAEAQNPDTLARYGHGTPDDWVERRLYSRWPQVGITHTYPTSAKFSVKPYEFDLGWAYIRALSALGLARARKTPPKPAFGAVRPVADAATLETLVTHRYEVMAAYARQMRAMREELRQLWSSSVRSSEQLAQDLHAWCQRAEASGIAALQEFSQRLRALRTASAMPT